MTGNESRPAAKSWSARRFTPLVVLVAGLAAFFAFGLDDYVSFYALRDHREVLLQFVASHGVRAALLFMACYAVVIAFSIPGGAVMTIAGGFFFGTIAGTVYVVIAATVGATALFLAARTALGDALRAKAGPAMKKMEAGFRKNALNYLLVLRLVPLFPFWLVNLVPALLGVPLGTYLIATFVGIIPGTFVYVSVGNGLGAVFDAGEMPDLSIVFAPDILIPLVGLALLALVPVAYKKFKGLNGDAGGSNDPMPGP